MRARDAARYANLGFLLALLVIGAGWEFVGTTVVAPLPAWKATLLFDLELLGLGIGFFSPWVFWVVLPLLE